MIHASRSRALVASAVRPLVADQYPITLPNEYRYAHLSLALIDAIYSIGVHYEGTHDTVLRYARHQALSPYHESFSTRPPTEQQEPLSHLLQQYDMWGLEHMASTVYQNRQRTSSRSGILKAEAIRRAAELLDRHQTHYFQDIPRLIQDQTFETEFIKIPGQGSGIALSYFWMLTGSDHMIKPDRHIVNFLARILGLSTVSTPDAISLLQDVALILQADYPLLTARALDYAIWDAERGSSKIPR